jgi:hypothetical protein
MSLQFVSFTVSIITPAGNRSTLAATTGLPRGFFGDVSLRSYQLLLPT